MAADPLMQSMEQLAATLTCTRSEFGEVYMQALKQSGSDSSPFKVVVVGIGPADVARAFAKALRVADKDGWLVDLWTGLEQRNYTAGTHAGAPKTDFQRLVSTGIDMKDASIIRTTLPKRISQVCLIEIDDGQSIGSGFLVGPNTVLTNWHVISGLLDDDNVPLDGAQKRIKVRFDHVSRATRENACHVYKNKWLLHYSTAHPAEAAHDDDPAIRNESREDFKGFLDFAIIALASCPGNERGYVKLDSAITPDSGTKGHILQHPAAWEQKIASGDFWGSRFDSHDQRLLYRIDTLGGSSGGMIVDSEFNFVGLHQGAINTPIDGKLMNTGIAGAAINDVAGADHKPPESTVLAFRLRDHSGPIIGREKCQTWIHECREGVPRIMYVHARGRNKGTSFTSSIMQACLPDSENLITVVSAGMLDPEAATAAGYLLRQMGLSDDGLPDPAAAQTTPSAWIKSRLLPVFRDRLNESHGQSLRWLVIDNLDSEPLAAATVKEFLEALYADIEQFPRLRIVLIGYKARPAGANPALVKKETILDPDQVEIGKYIRLRYTDRLIDFDYHGGEIKRLATLVDSSSSSVNTSDLSEIEKLTDYVKQNVDEMIDNPATEV